VIPAYCAAGTIADVLRALRDAIPGARLIVVDDGSTDDTSLRARPLADELLRHDDNLGKGRALRAGIAAALDRDADVVVTIDADGQHDAADAPRLLQALDDADVVVGQRIRSSGMMPVTRRVTNALSSAAIALVSGQRLHDTQSGFRAIRRRVLTAVAPLRRPIRIRDRLPRACLTTGVRRSQRSGAYTVRPTESFSGSARLHSHCANHLAPSRHDQRETRYVNATSLHE
jgi:glycosyltransferase involved in cell wall biosynthesis